MPSSSRRSSVTAPAIVHYLRCIGYDLSPGRADRVELRHAGEARHPVPDAPSAPERWSPTGCRSSMPTTRARPSGCPECPSGHATSSGTTSPIPLRERRATTASSATKVMVPIDGKVREGVGLLGSPSFEIPRSVERDTQVRPPEDRGRAAPPARGQEQAQRRHHRVVPAGAVELLLRDHDARLGRRGPLRLIRGGDGRADQPRHPPAQRRLSSCWSNVPSTGFRQLQPLYCSIYDRAFWRHERFWKMAQVSQFIQAFNGTPFKNIIWRLLGVRVGSRVFDDGCGMPEKTLVSHRGRLHTQCGEHHPVPLAGGRRLQVRPHHDRRRLHDRGRRIGPLRRDDGRRGGARPRLLPHEGRGSRTVCRVGGKPGPGDPRRATGGPGPPCPAPRGTGRRAGPAAGRCGPGSSGSAPARRCWWRPPFSHWGWPPVWPLSAA